jgi:SAM-dependent methyltransferase
MNGRRHRKRRRTRSHSGPWPRWRVINHLISHHNYTTYLEIGTAEMRCLNRVKCKTKVGVDPVKRGRKKPTYLMTSDQFFKRCDKTFDIIFIDGLHFHEQVEKDILNSLRVLNPNGTIVCHDMNPAARENQVRRKRPSQWNGDCWKAWVKLRCTRKDLWMAVVGTDHGCGIIRYGSQKLLPNNYELTWENFAQNRIEWLNLINIEQFQCLFRLRFL